jgi:hypothetical protein
MHMQESKSNYAPYKTLGAHLKYVREQKSETIAEAAGAVEIDIDVLNRIESGHECPAEDILMLLIDHFGVQDQEAVQLWESAGYDRREPRNPLENLDKNATVVVLAMDMRTQYSDGVDVTVSPSGVIMQFTQAGADSNRQPVARIGMSYEQAQQVLNTLQQAILLGRSGYTRRRLEPPQNS